MKLEIRLALESDSSEILDIIKSRHVDSSNASKETKTGLIDYRIPSEDRIKSKISKGVTYVAIENQKMAGFVDNFYSENLKDAFPNDVIINRFLELEKDPFVYLNTLAVRQEYESRGVSTLLFETTYANVSKNEKPIWCCIVHEPIKNLMSEAMCTKRFEFKLMEEFKTNFGITFGMYKKDLE